MAGSNSPTAVPGTADRSSSGPVHSDDPILESALTDMVTEGFQPDQTLGEIESTTETGQDEPAGHTPAGDAPPAREGTASPPSPGPSGQSPTDPTPDAPDEDFTNAAPLTFMVDGTPQTFDAIKVFPGEGALIREADLPRLQTELANATHYLAQSRELVRQLHDVERVSEWKQTDPQGRETILTGAPAIQAARIAHANTLAELTTLKQALADPAKRTALIAGVDENGHVVFNPDALANLDTQAELLALKLQQGIQQRFPVQAQAQAATAPDLSTQAPAVVNAYAAKLGVQGLTPDDVTMLASLVPSFIRPATQADRQLDPTLRVGEPVVDARFEAQVKHLGKVRSDALASQTKAAATGETAGKHNAAMNRARQPQKQIAQTKAAPNASEPAKKQGKAEAWDAILQNALQEINV